MIFECETCKDGNELYENQTCPICKQLGLKKGFVIYGR